MEKKEKLGDTQQWVHSRNDKFITIPEIEQLCDMLYEKFSREFKLNKALIEENRTLKEGVWEKEDVARLKKEVEDLHRGFPITKKEWDDIYKWVDDHNTDINSRTPHFVKRFEFVPTPIGYSGKVVCGCGAEYEFHELG